MIVSLQSLAGPCLSRRRKMAMPQIGIVNDEDTLVFLMTELMTDYMNLI